MAFKLYKGDPFLVKNETKLKSFLETVPLSPHVFELKHEPEETAWTCYAIFNRQTLEIDEIKVNKTPTANRNSHYRIYESIDNEYAQAVWPNISNGEARQIKKHLYKAKTIDEIDNWKTAVCECETCGSCE
jgi:hypothetical protein